MYRGDGFTPSALIISLIEVLHSSIKSYSFAHAHNKPITQYYITQHNTQQVPLYKFHWSSQKRVPPYQE